MKKVPTPGQHSIEELCDFLGIAPEQCLKTLIVNGTDEELVALVLRGDHELNRLKAEKLSQVAAPLRLAKQAEIRRRLGCDIGSLGPLDLPIATIVDHSAAQLDDFVCGANEDGQHLSGVNWGRDLAEPECDDLRYVIEGETLAAGEGKIRIARGIEVGHIFQLGTKYSAAMKANCLNEKGQASALLMGCYGIGISRVVAAAIEQNHDAKGIIWPDALAPWQLALVPIHMHKSERLRAAVMALYADLQEAGIEVLLDDRRERPGVMFADMELTGIPHRLTFSESGLDAGTIEYQGRRAGESMDLPLAEALAWMKKISN